MAVPNTGNFNLQDVITEMDLGVGEGLQECFDDSDDSAFDTSNNPNSYGTDNNLLNWRNYNSSTSTARTLIVEGSNYWDGNEYFSYAYVWDASESDQDITFTWKYVGYVGDSAPIVKTGGSMGTVRQPGYTTGSITGNLDTDLGAFWLEDTFFVYPLVSESYALFEFTLTSAEIDNVPSSPDNKVTVSQS